MARSMQSESSSTGDGLGTGPVNDASVHEVLLIDEEVANITKEMEVLEERRRNLWIQRNRKQLISRILPEVLLNIFLILRCISQEITENYDGTGALWDWITITQVCKSWRELSISYTYLWSTISRICDVHKARAFLARAGQSDVDIYYRSYLPPPASPIDLLLQEHMSRVRKLDLIFKRHDVYVCLIDNWFSNSLPKLKELHLRRFYSDESEVVGMILNKWTPAAQLEVVELANIALNWDHPVFCGLQELLLSNIFNGPSVAEMLTILNNCNTTIRKLGIVSVRFRVTGDEWRIEPGLVQLPNLRAFELFTAVGDNSDRNGYFKLLDGLDLNLRDETVFRFNLVFGSNLPEGFESGQLTKIPKTLWRLITHSFRELTVVFFNEYLQFKIIQDPTSRRAFQRNEHSLMALTFRYSEGSRWGKNAMGSIAAFVRQRCIQDVENINLQFQMDHMNYSELTRALKKPLWTEIFGAVPNIKRIELVYKQQFNKVDLDSLDGLISALLESDLSDHGMQPSLCSNLEEIALLNVDVSYDQVPMVFEKLLDYLKSRRDNGKKLRKLRLALRGLGSAEELKWIESRLMDTVKELSFEPFLEELLM